MVSSINWLDHDDAARERSLRILALFQAQEARDELGIGAIRDSIADLFFPGTSTLHTHVKYMLIVPWIYLELEAKEIASRDIAKKARAMELDLVEPLIANSEDGLGIFGSSAGAGLKRLPSSIYWAGLGAWKIRQFEGSQEYYHRNMDHIYALRNEATRRNEEELGLGERAKTWHSQIPAPPDNYPADLTLDLSISEAQFLKERILDSFPESLMAFLLVHCEPVETDFPWDHPDWARFSPKHQEQLQHARLFSTLMHGAAILYNFHLADISEKIDLRDQYGTAFSIWASELPDQEIREWSLERLYELIENQSHIINKRTKDFVRSWWILAKNGANTLLQDQAAKQLIVHREGELKHGRSRFGNQQARDQWSGSSGMGKMNFRWPKAKTMLMEIQQGLKGEASA